MSAAGRGLPPSSKGVKSIQTSALVPSLFVFDGGAFDTAAGVNLTAAIQALELRKADYLKGAGSGDLE